MTSLRTVNQGNVDYLSTHAFMDDIDSGGSTIVAFASDFGPTFKGSPTIQIGSESFVLTKVPAGDSANWWEYRSLAPRHMKVNRVVIYNT